MSVLALAVLAQLAVATRPVQPVLAFPEQGLDDLAAYRGYQSRFFRDAAQNTFQIYIDDRSARVVHIMADADNASAAFTARDANGRTAPIAWNGSGGAVSATGRTRRFDHKLIAGTPTLHLGSFLLGSMRVERDFQYFQKGREAFSPIPYPITEVDQLLATLEKLPSAVQTQHLAILNAPTMHALRARMYPHIELQRVGLFWVARVQQLTLNARDTLTIELRVNARTVDASVAGDSLTLHARSGTKVPFDVRVSTTAQPLTPLSRSQIFAPDFLSFLESAKARGARGASRNDTAAVRARRMERQVRGVELLVSREKLMAGLPTYATYFGRDMLMTALMMQPIWQHEAQEAVIAAALRKLGPMGEVSHEEALGDQATRESAGEYVALMKAQSESAERGDNAKADSLLARAAAVLTNFRTVRENYHMIDDEYQLAIVAARWITDPAVSAEAKRAFLLRTVPGGDTHVSRLMRELQLIARLTAAYTNEPITANLIAFSPREPSGFGTASWRDSGAGYGGGKFAMDINAIWVPHALEATGQILRAVRELGLDTQASVASDTPLARLVGSAASLQRAIDVWRDAAKHFVVRRTAAEVRANVTARLAAMPANERSYWDALPTTATSMTDSLTFLAVALDATGAPIGVANTDPATQLFLGDGEGRTTPSTPAERARTLNDVRLFVRPYPAGLFVDRIGPVVSNDAYASSTVWESFVKDPYHGPRVVWGREVTLFLLGAANRIAMEEKQAQPDAAYIAELRAAMQKIRLAVEQSAFHTELWSYSFEQGTLGALRYGSGNEIQLWSTTDLAMQYVLDRIKR
jgi:hypothetical protein